MYTDSFFKNYIIYIISDKHPDYMVWISAIVLIGIVAYVFFMGRFVERYIKSAKTQESFDVRKSWINFLKKPHSILLFLIMTPAVSTVFWSIFS